MIGFHEAMHDRRALYDTSGNKIGYLDSQNRLLRPDGTLVARIKAFKVNTGLAHPQGGQRTQSTWWPRIADWKAR
jgi:hypothetical protein